MMGCTHKEPIVSTTEAEVHSSGVILDTRRNRVGILNLRECGLSQYSLLSLQQAARIWKEKAGGFHTEFP